MLVVQVLRPACHRLASFQLLLNLSRCYPPFKVLVVGNLHSTGFSWQHHDHKFWVRVRSRLRSADASPPKT